MFVSHKYNLWETEKNIDIKTYHSKLKLKIVLIFYVLAFCNIVLKRLLWFFLSLSTFEIDLC